MQLFEHYSLKSFNTFGMDVYARYFGAFSTGDELAWLLGLPEFATHPPFILGGGSNILFRGNVENLVLKNEIRGIEKVNEDNDHVYIKAGAGENWHHFVSHCIEQDWAGLENLSLIPGNVGASPMQNIGAYGVEVKDVFHSLEALDLEEKTTRTFYREECEFGYRESIFKRKYKGRFAILSVTFRLDKTPRYHTSYGAITQELANMGVRELSIQAISQAVINIRSSKLPDPAVIGNAGSFFKNPEVSAAKEQQLRENFPGIVSYPLANGNYKLAAGWLIEQCGWKGYRDGDAGVHERQALVLVNYGQATGEEIYRLSERIEESIREKFGVTLEREVNIYP